MLHFIFGALSAKKKAARTHDAGSLPFSPLLWRYNNPASAIGSGVTQTITIAQVS